MDYWLLAHLLLWGVSLFIAFICLRRLLTHLKPLRNVYFYKLYPLALLSTPSVPRKVSIWSSCKRLVHLCGFLAYSNLQFDLPRALHLYLWVCFLAATLTANYAVSLILMTEDDIRIDVAAGVGGGCSLVCIALVLTVEAIFVTGLNQKNRVREDAHFGLEIESANVSTLIHKGPAPGKSEVTETNNASTRRQTGIEGPRKDVHELTFRMNPEAAEISSDSLLPGDSSVLVPSGSPAPTIELSALALLIGMGVAAVWGTFVVTQRTGVHLEPCLFMWLVGVGVDIPIRFIIALLLSLTGLMRNYAKEFAVLDYGLRCSDLQRFSTAPRADLSQVRSPTAQTNLLMPPFPQDVEVTPENTVEPLRYQSEESDNSPSEPRLSLLPPPTLGELRKEDEELKNVECEISLPTSPHFKPPTPNTFPLIEQDDEIPQPEESVEELGNLLAEDEPPVALPAMPGLDTAKPSLPDASASLDASASFSLKPGNPPPVDTPAVETPPELAHLMKGVPPLSPSKTGLPLVPTTPPKTLISSIKPQAVQASPQSDLPLKETVPAAKSIPPAGKMPSQVPEPAPIPVKEAVPGPVAGPKPATPPVKVTPPKPVVHPVDEVKAKPASPQDRASIPAADPPEESKAPIVPVPQEPALIPKPVVHPVKEVEAAPSSASPQEVPAVSSPQSVLPATLPASALEQPPVSELEAVLQPAADTPAPRLPKTPSDVHSVDSARAHLTTAQKIAKSRISLQEDSSENMSPKDSDLSSEDFLHETVEDLPLSSRQRPITSQTLQAESRESIPEVIEAESDPAEPADEEPLSKSGDTPQSSRTAKRIKAALPSKPRKVNIPSQRYSEDDFDPEIPQEKAADLRPESEGDGLAADQPDQEILVAAERVPISVLPSLPREAVEHRPVLPSVPSPSKADIEEIILPKNSPPKPRVQKPSDAPKVPVKPVLKGTRIITPETQDPPILFVDPFPVPGEEEQYSDILSTARGSKAAFPAPPHHSEAMDILQEPEKPYVPLEIGGKKPPKAVKKAGNSSGVAKEKRGRKKDEKNWSEGDDDAPPLVNSLVKPRKNQPSFLKPQRYHSERPGSPEATEPTHWQAPGTNTDILYDEQVSPVAKNSHQFGFSAGQPLKEVQYEADVFNRAQSPTAAHDTKISFHTSETSTSRTILAPTDPREAERRRIADELLQLSRNQSQLTELDVGRLNEILSARVEFHKKYGYRPNDFDSPYEEIMSLREDPNPPRKVVAAGAPAHRAQAAKLKSLHDRYKEGSSKPGRGLSHHDSLASLGLGFAPDMSKARKKLYQMVSSQSSANLPGHDLLNIQLPSSPINEDPNDQSPRLVSEVWR